MNKIVKRMLLLVLPIVTIVLESLPYGAVLVFANNEGEQIVKTFSYFSLMPFVYANFTPFLTAVLSCVCLLIAIIFLFTGSARAFGLLRIFLTVTAIVSIGWVIDLKYAPIVAILITISLVLERIFVQFYRENH